MALKKTSEIVSIGFSILETDKNTFTQERVDLQLSALDQEVFVVLAVDLEPSPPDSVTATNTASEMSVSTTALLSVGNINASQVIANSKISIESELGADPGVGVGFTRQSMDAPQANLDYISIIATNDFFVQIQGRNNTAQKLGFGRMYGYRAKADAATYAALVQSEVLSS